MVNSKLFNIIWDREALNHFKEILTYLSEQSNSASQIVKTSVLDKLSFLPQNPYSYPIDKLKYPIDDNFRAFTVFSYRISYQICTEKSEIRILRIRHTSREPLEH